MTKLDILSDETKVEAVTKALGGSRKLYPSVALAVAALTKAAAATESFYGLPVAMLGINPETGEGDESIYTPDMAVMIATVGTRVEVGTKKMNGIKGITLLPQPTLAAYIASDEGKAWLEKIAEKESAHVAFRPFREAESIEQFLSGTDRVPTTVSAFATESTRGGGVDTEIFDLVWRSFRAALTKDKPDFAKFVPVKPEVVKAIRSKAYAMEKFEDVENIRGFEWIAKSIINAAEGEKLDASSIKEWLAGRDEFVFPAREVAELDPSKLADLKLDF